MKRMIDNVDSLKKAAPFAAVWTRQIALVATTASAVHLSLILLDARPRARGDDACQDRDRDAQHQFLQRRLLTEQNNKKVNQGAQGTQTASPVWASTLWPVRQCDF